MRADAHFTKDEAPVSNFSDDYENKSLLQHATEEVNALLLKLSSVFTVGELDINFTLDGNRLVISIMRANGVPLVLSELNLIFRIAVDLGLLARTVEGGIEVLSSLPMLEDANLYSRVLALLKDSIDGSFSENSI